MSTDNCNGRRRPRRRNRDPMPGDLPLPEAMLAAMHRDPDAFLEFSRALDRVFATLDEQESFTPCGITCPLCYPALWPDELAADN
jgi:hypothetical protein